MPYQPWQNPYLPQGNQYQPGYMTAGGSYQMAQQQQSVHGFVYVTGLADAQRMKTELSATQWDMSYAMEQQPRFESKYRKKMTK